MVVRKNPKASHALVSRMTTANPWDRVLPKTTAVVNGLPQSSLMVPSVPVLNQLFKGAVATDYFISHSVAEGTAATYSTGVKRWMKFAPMIGSDAFMSIIPLEWQLMQPPPGVVKYTWPETCVMAFLSWLVTEGSRVKPRVACSYLSAVRFFWITKNIDISFLSLSAGIRATKAGMEKSWYTINQKCEADSRYLPISIDMILGFRESWQQPLTLRQLACYTAMLFGYSTLSRVSQYLPGTEDSKYREIHAEDVSFVIMQGGSEVAVPSYRAKDLVLSDIVGCRISRRFSKTDQNGKGFKYLFPRRELGPDRLFDITTSLWEYVSTVQPVQGKAFFFLPAENWLMSPAYYNDFLKGFARFHGFDPSRVSSHSLRVGGASALAAAGLPEYLIKEMGSWRSNAFLTYLRTCLQTFSDAQDAMCNANKFSVEKIRAAFL